MAGYIYDDNTTNPICDLTPEEHKLWERYNEIRYKIDRLATSEEAIPNEYLEEFEQVAQQLKQRRIKKPQPRRCHGSEKRGGVPHQARW